jgi:hypothetical protein
MGSAECWRPSTCPPHDTGCLELEPEPLPLVFTSCLAAGCPESSISPAFRFRGALVWVSRTCRGAGARLAGRISFAEGVNEFAVCCMAFVSVSTISIGRDGMIFNVSRSPVTCQHVASAAQCMQRLTDRAITDCEGGNLVALALLDDIIMFDDRCRLTGLLQ